MFFDMPSNTTMGGLFVMRKNTIIEHDTFKQIVQYNPAVTGTAARNHLKMEMLNSIINAIGEKWNRMKHETKSALEYLCFLSIERGFVYAGSQHVSERHDIDSSTVRRYLSFLEKGGCIGRLWRSSSKHNGRGQAVIFFTVHPYYQKYWQEMFFISYDSQPNTQADHVQETSNINENDSLIVSTIYQPNILKDLKERSKETLNSEFTSSRVPIQFTKYVSNFYDDAKTIEELYKVVKLQTRYLTYYSDQDRLELALYAFRQLIRKIRLDKRKIENIFGYFWGIVDKMLDQEYFELLLEGNYAG